MFLIIGSIIVVGSVLGGYVALGGHLIILWQPFELVIIGGSGIGAFVIANNKQVLGGTLGAIGSVLKGPKYKRSDYIDLISLQYQVFKLAKSKACWQWNRMSKTRARVPSSKNFRALQQIIM